LSNNYNRNKIDKNKVKMKPHNNKMSNMEEMSSKIKGKKGDKQAKAEATIIIKFGRIDFYS